MDEFLKVVTLLAEAITVLQCLQIIFMQRIKLDKFTVGIVLIYVTTYLLINLGFIPFIGIIAVYVLLGRFCYFKFKKSIIETVIKFLASCALVAGVEGVAIFITNFFRNGNNSMLILALSSIVGLTFAYLIRVLCYFSGKYIKEKRDVWKSGIMLFCGLQIMGLFIEYHYSKSTINIYVVIVSAFLICIFFYIHKLERAQNEIAKKNYELELQKIYGEAYEGLLLEVRKRQHDYKNQLVAIYGMHLTARTLDELVNMQKKYGDELRKDSKFDSILTCCNNSILAGFIYYRCVACENENIVIDYNIHIEQAECCFALHELIEILGILIDNACECVKMENSLEQHIKLEFQEDVDKLVFSVSNPTKYISFAEIDKMFISGYSNKGENRGIGLAKVRELVNKYAAEIEVFNSNPCDEKNWICFLIRIEK